MQPAASPGRRKRPPRVPYFLRPPQPHDWRWIVGGVGKALITLGLLMFAFVGYQLWGTGIATARAQNELHSEYERIMASTTTHPVTTTTAAPVSTDPTDTTLPTDTTVATTGTVPTAPVTPPVPSGDWVAHLEIPKIGLKKEVVEGISKSDLSKGPGHFRETPMPGQLGNAAIAGHRTTHGHPFLELDQLEPGDLIEVTTVAGHFTYRVTETFEVVPSDYADAIPTTDFTKATLTLATCTPAYVSSHRLIVRAELVAESSDQVLAPPPATAPPTDATLPGDDTETTAAAPDETEVPGATTATDPGAETTDGTDTTDSTDTPAAVVEPLDDGFSGGWFDDTDAILPSILWGLGLLGVGVAAYFIGKSAKRLYVSFLVGAIPFLLVLYFFFENIYRLLPPGL